MLPASSETRAVDGTDIAKALYLVVKTGVLVSYRVGIPREIVAGFKFVTGRSLVMAVALELVQIENPDELNLIFGQSHFIKTVEDVYESLIQSAPGIKFGFAFCEASGPCLIRTEGNDQALIDLATRNAEKIGAGHTFIVFLKDAFPINVLRSLTNVPEIVGLFAATANPLQVVIAKSDQGRGVVGVIDGGASQGVESDQDKEERMLLLRRFGYKRH